MTRENVLDLIESTKTRSAWGRGVKAYAEDLVNDLFDGIDGGWINPEDLCNGRMIEKALLNGAGSWSDYSWGSCSYIYNYQIAGRLCNPSELKKTRHGDRRPNKSEEWLDTQARALFQAAQIVKSAVLLSYTADR